MGNKFAKKDEKGKGKETTESKNTKKTHQKSPDNDNKRTGKTDPGTGDKWIQNMNRSSTGKSDYGIGTQSDKQYKEKGKVHANSKGPKK